MLKYTELIEQIECLMDDPTAAPMGRIAELASSYAEACEWVNEKALLCVNILRQGNASEALRINRELDLLENYKTLVFDDYDAWISAALTFGDVAIPPFNRRLIEELDAAQVCMRPIEEVLKSHRILALSHSPLAVRIPVLRKLVELDPRNTGWKNELRDYETARLELIYEELSRSLEYSDCVRLLKEVEGSKWSVEIPLKVKKKIALIRKDYENRNRQKQIEQLNAKLQEKADNLLQAYNNYDFEGAKRFRDSWTKLLAEYQKMEIIPPYDLIQSVDDVLSWINSEQEGQNLLKEFKAKVAAADRELRRSISIEKCQRLILDLSRSADAVGQPVPERFQRHLDKLIANEERKASQHNRLVTGILVVILLAVIGGVSFGVYEFIQWYRFNTLLDNLAKYQLAVSKDRNILPEAYQFVYILETSGYQLAAYPDVQKNIAYIKKLYEEDKVRHEDWKLLYDKIDRSVKKGVPSSLDEINELEKLSILKEEKAAFESLKKSNAVLLSESSAEFVKNLIEQLHELQTAAGKLIKSDKIEIADVVKLREIETQIVQIRQKFADYAFGKSSLEKAAKDFDAECSALLADVQKAIRQSNSDISLYEELDSLTMKMKSKSDYVQSLKNILEKYADSSYAKDFKEVIDAQNEWGAAYDWNDFIIHNQSIFRGGTSRTAVQLKDFLDQWSALPFKPNELLTVNKIEGRIPYYQSIVDCNPSASLKTLKELCYLYYRIELWYYEDPSGKRYYFNKRPGVAGRQRLNYMESVSVESDNRILIEATSPIDPLNNRVFSQKINNLLGMINDKSKFTECGIKILDVIYSDTSLNDPIVKYRFLTAALDCFTKSDQIIHENFDSFVPQLDNEELKSCNPFDPEEASTLRAEAKRMLDRLKDFSNRIKIAQKRNEQLAQPFPVETFKPFGWLDKDGSQWMIRGITPEEDGELFIVSNKDIVSIGTVKNKEVKMKSVSSVKRGIPVFIIKMIKL